MRAISLSLVCVCLVTDALRHTVRLSRSWHRTNEPQATVEGENQTTSGKPTKPKTVKLDERDRPGYEETTTTEAPINISNITFEPVGTLPPILHVEPTLSPARPRNYSPMRSPAETEVYLFGPTPPPERGHGIMHGCVWQPGFYKCDCVEQKDACEEASLDCEVQVQKLEMVSPDAAVERQKAQMELPRWTALTQQTTADGSRDAKQPFDYPESAAEQALLKFPIPGYGGGSTDFVSKLNAQSTDATMPSEFGYRLFSDRPDWDSIAMGACSQNVMKELKSCLIYFRSCYKNLQRLNEWHDSTLEDTVRIQSQTV